MKGWPLVRAAVALLALLLLGIPLLKLTAPPPPARVAVGPAPVVVVPKEKVTVVLTFTQPPESFVLRHLGQDVLTSGGEPSFEYRQELETEFPPEGIDLVIQAEWAEHFRKAGVSVEVIRADGRRQTQTVWGKKEIEEVLTFPGDEPKP